MALIRLILILLLLGAGTFLAWQNQGLLVITLLGTPMQPLPLGGLLLLSILFGFGVGILLLFLLSSKAPSASSRTFRRPQSRKTKSKNPFKSLFSSPFKTNPFSVPSQSKAPQSRSSYSTQRTRSDWYDPPAQDWTGSPTGSAAQEYVSRSPQATDRESYPNRFAEDEPSDAFGRSRKESSSDRVVDADYRVLRQPHSPPPSDDDWDDEFFQDGR
jgi:hypothetical protein